ncbi:P-loop containing nucleoside triphosphate hydrolase protein [Gamsiella multidivaricata]|uniref:P-loop containing nucleoside triphosphate hydrolase protein n=1 Tax=Gamsiella multidivaricata TaxID=101098 RepID=UPI0022204EC7|nr:P-loop containing nucleoside triphosphate hydrolase protein [Gamsiella multidivaricata]KAI7821172.1 P-loop containing nucleoside triphosphate hydrolase protein [Gamsiella multidivaricata]
MSLGQHQLMSLARAMLAKNTRVLCLDEVTAAIDIETDNAIQQALRREINTIMDSDQILVLDNGEMKEFESPAKLLADPTSIFHSLAKESGNL